jgi:hypothetical protein
LVELHATLVPHLRQGALDICLLHPGLVDCPGFCQGLIARVNAALDHPIGGINTSRIDSQGLLKQVDCLSVALLHTYHPAQIVQHQV